MGMAAHLRWRIIVVVVAILVGVFYLAPSVTEDLPAWWKNHVEKIHLGLDLRGGMHLVTEVQTDKAVENTLSQYVQTLEQILDDKKFPYIELKIRPDETLAVGLVDQAGDEKFMKIMNDEFPSLKRINSESTPDQYVIFFQLNQNDVRNIKDSAVKQALETIRNRVDQFGVTEPVIQRQGADRILIQLPGIKDPERAKKLLRQTALLEFKLVNDDANLEEAVKGNIPPDSELLYHEVVNPETKEISKKEPLVLKKRTLLTGDTIVDAQPQMESSRFNEPYVSITFNSKGGKLFKAITTANVGKRLAIILDDVVKSAPVIREPIPGGRAQIEGNFTLEEAKDLAIVLRAGSLPAPIKTLEERTVGPSLGKDSIEQGIRATVIGSLLVIVFMMVYYALSGVVANFALLLNLLLIFGTLAIFGATLTLPGIAGIVLTIGMAVDANVLIFERMREEIRAGKTPWAAIDAGYSKAFSAIFDSNVTTIVAAAVLFQFGTGPIKGFAVTLCIGLLANFFTAVFVTRVVYDYFVMVRKAQRISI